MNFKNLLISLIRSAPLKPSMQESIIFFLKLGYWPNLSSPKTFNEKINNQKLYPSHPLISQCSDKFAVRDIVKERVGDEYLVPVLFHGPKLTPEELLALGDQIVVKTNHDSGSIHFIEENSIEQARKVVDLVDAALQSDYGSITNQPAYSDIRPLIIVEKKLTKTDEALPIDYKVFCFRQDDGSVKTLVEVHFDRGLPSYHFTFYDSDLNLIDLKGFEATPFPVPDKWPEMRQVAESVAEGFDYVRVDLYCVDSKIYFGEMTFFPSGGRWSYTRKSGKRNDFDLELGKLWLAQ